MQSTCLKQSSGAWAGVMLAIAVAAFPVVATARERGINQPGAAGNVGVPAVGRDPGINQPGAVGNRRRVVP